LKITTGGDCPFVERRVDGKEKQKLQRETEIGIEILFQQLFCNFELSLKQRI
jgi:hypothetical protein